MKTNCQCSAHPLIGHLCHIFLRLRDHQRRGGKNVRARGPGGLQWPSGHHSDFLYMAGLLCSGSHSTYGCQHKTYTRSRQSTLRHAMRRGSWALTHNSGTVENWQLLGNRESIFFKGGHEPEERAPRSGVYGPRKLGDTDLGVQGEGVDLGGDGEKCGGVNLSQI